MGLTVGVLGASGYGGGEVLRLLANHPEVEVVAAAAERRAGEAVGRVHPHLAALRDLHLCTTAEALRQPATALISCLPHGEFARLRDEVRADIVVDVADDHRAAPGWVYGLTEFARPDIAGARRIANPGCYPTAMLLCTVPFARAGAVGGPVIVDALSGVSGAGRKADDRLLFAHLDGGAGAYGDVRHRHVPEMERGLSSFGNLEAVVSFTPHLVPMARGVVATVRAPLRAALDDDAAMAVLRDAYAAERFVDVVDWWPATKAVSGTNRAQVSARVDERAGMLVCAAAIDNLGKGAAGQAIQNLNVAAGIEETAGLSAFGVWP